MAEKGDTRGEERQEAFPWELRKLAGRLLDMLVEGTESRAVARYRLGSEPTATEGTTSSTSLSDGKS